MRVINWVIIFVLFILIGTSSYVWAADVGYSFKVVDFKPETSVVTLSSWGGAGGPGPEQPALVVEVTAQLVYNKTVNGKIEGALERVGELKSSITLKRSEKEGFHADILSGIMFLPDSKSVGRPVISSHSKLDGINAEKIKELIKKENIEYRKMILNSAWQAVVEGVGKQGKISIKNFDDPLIKDGVDKMIQAFVDRTMSDFPERLEKMILAFPDIEKKYQENRVSNSFPVKKDATVTSSAPVSQKILGVVSEDPAPRGTAVSKHTSASADKDRDLQSYYDELGVKREKI